MRGAPWKIFTIPAGTDYRFSSADFSIRQASNLVLQVGPTVQQRTGTSLPPAPARLWFDVRYGLVVDGGHNISIVGPLEIDYIQGAHFQGTVQSLGNSTMSVTTDQGFLDPLSFCALYCSAHWSEREVGPSLWRRAGGFSNQPIRVPRSPVTRQADGSYAFR